MSTLAPVSSYIWRQFDNLGKMASRAWVYVYSGTELADLYADEVGTPATNPIQLDGSGKAFSSAFPVRTRSRSARGRALAARSSTRGPRSICSGSRRPPVPDRWRPARPTRKSGRFKADFDAVIVCSRAKRRRRRRRAFSSRCRLASTTTERH